MVGNDPVPNHLDGWGDPSDDRKQRGRQLPRSGEHQVGYPPRRLHTVRYRTIADHQRWETLLTLPGPGEVGASAVCERSEG